MAEYWGLLVLVVVRTCCRRRGDLCRKIVHPFQPNFATVCPVNRITLIIMTEEMLVDPCLFFPGLVMIAKLIFHTGVE